MSKKISIVIPVYNGEKVLAKCLQSVLSQDIEIHECIIIDNNSTDTTAVIVKEFQKTHKNVVYVFEPRIGRGAARFKGVEVATGDIIVMTDVDCIVSAEWVRLLTQPIREGREVVTVGWQYDTAHTYWSHQIQHLHEFLLKNSIDPQGYASFTDTKNFASDAKLLKSVQFDPRFIALEDVDLEFRLRTKARFKYLPDVKVGHAHPNTLFSVVKSTYVRSYWQAQLYHKWKGVPDSRGGFVFPIITPLRFYISLLGINTQAIKEQGYAHLPFFIVFDLTWKIAAAIGFSRMNKVFKILEK